MTRQKEQEGKMNLKLITESIKLYKNFPLALACYLNHPKRDTLGILRLRNGLKFIFRPNEMNDFEAIHDIFTGCYETSKDARVIIDIGSHIGSYSIYASNLFKDSKIYSFEPNKENYSIFLWNIKMNDIKNIKPFNLGISPHGGKIKLFLGNNTGRHSIVNETDNFEEIGTMRLEDVFRLNQLKKCDILKMDVEGAEYEILFSTPDWIFEKIEMVILEWHKNKRYGKEDLTAFLAKKNYRIIKDERALDGGGVLIFCKA